jgi:hypothetical protein
MRWHREAAASASDHVHADAAQLTLWMNGAGSLADVRHALSGVEGLDLADASVLAPAGGAASPESGNAVTVRVIDVDKLDFVALDRALKQNGLVAGRMELSGVPHFSLQARFPRLSGQQTDQSVEARIAYMKARGMGVTLEWLDSVNMNAQDKALTAYARYVEPGKSVNIGELVAGLNQIGLAPESLRVVVGDHPDHGAAR